MKVLQVINSLDTGGAEKLILDSILLYKERGVDMEVLLLLDKHTPFRQTLEDTYQVKVQALTKGSLYNPFLIFKIIPFLRAYDVLHGHLFPVLYWLAFAKAVYFSRTPLVFTEHSTSNKRRDHIIFKYVDRFAYNKINRIGCISKGTLAQLLKHVNVNEKALVINNGIDLNKFKPRRLKGEKGEERDKKNYTLIQVSKFRHPKDQITLVKSMSLLPRFIRLKLVGDGPTRIECEKLVMDLNLEDRVEFMGQRFDIPDLIGGSDIVILSSHWEGFGLSIVEGMAMRKPAIACDVPGVSEILNGYGLLFKPSHQQELAQHILNLIQDQEYYTKIAMQCYERAQEYGIEQMVDAYIEVYKSLLVE